MLLFITGSALLRMLNHILTDEVFNSGVTDYLNSKMYGNAEQKDLWSALTTAARRKGDFDADVAVVMDSWTLQTGFPVLTVERNYENGSVTFTQVNFFSLFSIIFSPSLVDFMAPNHKV